MDTSTQKSTKKTAMLNKAKIILLIPLMFFLIVKSAVPVHAASMYITGGKTTAAGSIVTVNVVVSSPTQSMNAVSGRLSFPTDKLEVTSINKAGSIVNLWVREPTFSNSEGNVNFEGIVLNPGFVGSSGKILTVNFKTKTPGSAAISFAQGTLLANDGKGTNIVSGLTRTVFTITPPPPPPAPTPKEEPQPNLIPRNLLSKQVVDQEKWYRGVVPKFEWELPEGTTGVSAAVNKDPNYNLPNTSLGLIKEFETKNLESGIWYFYLKLKNTKGWGSTTRHKIMLDNEKPARLEVKHIPQNNPTLPKVKIELSANDDISGLSHYEIYDEDFEKPFVWTEINSKQIDLPPLPPGKHFLVARAFDKAGNFSVESLDVQIEALDSPQVEFVQGEGIMLKGSSKYIDAKINIFMEDSEGKTTKEVINLDEKGNFNYKKQIEGLYIVWIEIEDSNGAKSFASKKHVFSSAASLSAIHSSALASYQYLIPAILVLLFSVFCFTLLRKRLKSILLKNKLNSLKIKNGDHELIDHVAHSIQKEIGVLEATKEGRELTGEEKEVLVQLKKENKEIKHFLNAKKYIGED